MLNSQEINILGNVINSSFGQSSYQQAGHYINHKVYPDNQSDGLILEIRFETLLILRPDEVETSIKKYDNISTKAIIEKLAEVKTNFRTESGVILRSEELEKNKPVIETISQNRSIYRGKFYKTFKYVLKN